MRRGPWREGRLLDRAGAPSGGVPSVRALLGVDDSPGGGRRIVCRFCGHTITSERARLEVGGAHRHTRSNPAGFVYCIGCYRVAPGSHPVGPPCEEHTWFAGYAWQIVLCGGCHAHLGWVFRAPDDLFFGLIVERLRVDDEEPSGPT